MKRKDVSGGIIGAVVKGGAGLVRSRDISKIRALSIPFSVFVVSLFLSAVRAPVGTYPYSYAVVAASSGGVYTLAAILGAVVATFTMDTGGLWQVIILLGMVAVRTAVCFFKGDFKEKNGLFRRLFRERGYIKTVVAAGGAAAAGCIAVVESRSIYYGLFSALFGIGSAAVVCAAFVLLCDKGASSSKRSVGFLFLILGLAASLDMFGLPFSLVAVASFLALVYFSRVGGALFSSAAGAVLGLAVGAPYGVAFASVGLMLSLLWDYSRSGAVILAGIVCSVCSLFCAGTDALSEVIAEIALACAVAAPLASMGYIPASIPSFFEFIKGDLPDLGRFPVENCRHQRIGDALDGLSRMLLEISGRMRLPTKEESKRICTTVRAKVCSGCRHSDECSGREDGEVSSMFSNMAYWLSRKGRVSARIVPDSIARRCFNMDVILEDINSFAKRTAGLSGVSRRTELLSSDYKAVAGLMKEISSEEVCERDEEGERALAKELFEMGFGFSTASVYGKRDRRVYLKGIDLSSASVGEEDIRLCVGRVLGGQFSSPEFSVDKTQVSASMRSVPLFRLESGQYGISSRRDCASGDSVTAFNNGEGYFYTLVSDGMGSGREAALTSGLSAAFLEKLLSAGCPMRNALEMLNCFVRGAEGECFTTVDLMETDLYTGRARFVKSGAAPSFVIRKGQLYRLHSKTVPVGIMRALDAEALTFDLCSGDTVIMMSDGVSGSYEESPWLYDLLSEGILGMEDPECAARCIATAAAENTGREDDITVCVIKVRSA